MKTLKKQSDYYNYNKRTVGDFIHDVSEKGWGSTVADRKMWAEMKMNPTDLADVSGATYTYLMNGQAPNSNWTGVFRPGEKLRLRFINGSAMTYFDVRIPGLKMTVVAADGLHVKPVSVDEFRIAVAETFDVIVEPTQEAYTLFAQSMDRTGYARGTLAAKAGLSAPVPPLDPRPLVTMDDMGMGGMDHGSMAGMDHSAMAMPGMQSHPETEKDNPLVDMQAMTTSPKLDDPGLGLRNNGRRVLTYSDLRSTFEDPDGREPSRTIELHLTGHMEKFAWSFNGVKFSDAEPAAPQIRRAGSGGAGQRHDDDSPHPSARHVERPRRRERRVHGAQTHHRHAARLPTQLSGDRRCARPLGLSLPSPVPHGNGHVP